MNRNQIIKTLACWIGYCGFAGWSAWMTAESLSMSLALKPTWVVFIFVFVVAILAGFCLKGVINETSNRTNPNKARFVLCLLGFLLFWGVSFVTNVHYNLMRNDGLKVVKAELGNYESYVNGKVRDDDSKVDEDKQNALALLKASVDSLANKFGRECDNTVRYGFAESAVQDLIDIERYFISTAKQYEDYNAYTNTIFDPERDKGDIGATGYKRVEGIKGKYANRILTQRLRRQEAIETFYNKKKGQRSDLIALNHFIKDSLNPVDIPQLEEIASPEAYYQFQKIQFSTIRQHLTPDDLATIDRSTMESKTDKVEDIDAGKFRYRIYPSERMFNTFNVWDDMLHGHMPTGMKLLGWILISLIIDIVAFVLRSLV